MVAKCMGGPCDGREWQVKPTEIKPRLELAVPGRAVKALYWAIAIEGSQVFYAWHQNMKCKCGRTA